MIEEEKNNKRLLVMAGGTGGHIFPALAVAKKLAACGWQIRWLGTMDRMESELVPQNGIEIDFISVKGLRGSGMMQKLRAPWMLFSAIRQANKHMQAYQPHVVLGMGGYVSGPGGVAAYLRNVPLLVHEQNAVAGLTNRWLAKIATQVLQAFPGALSNAQVVGNPVRQDVCELPAHAAYDDANPLKVLVMGGSQGAQILNKTLPHALSKLARPVQVRHQVGKGNEPFTAQQYHAANLPASVTYQLLEFIDDVTEAYQWADLVICRSGALTVSESAAAGVAAIFVPFQHKDRQQALNAEYLTNSKAALMIEQTELSAERLAQTLETLNAATLNAMAAKARSLAVLDAAEQVACAIKQIAK
ncbi:MAG: undecaprenyldiphospho-muramoylpentapeptide beta-N-acetylglucosaminyltransferase [Enterovibrio sp.]